METVKAQLGFPSDDGREWKAAIVVQGIYFPNKTQRSIQIFLERNDPNVLVIVSTYLPPQEYDGEQLIGSFLSPFEKSIVISKQGQYVGRLVYLFLKIPSRTEDPVFWSTNFHNQNSQRLSTYVGAKYAYDLGIQLTLKCRSDSFLGINNVCHELYSKFVFKFPITQKDSPPIKARLVISDYTIGKREAWSYEFLCDFWIFGFTSDLITFFNLGPDSAWDGGKGISVNFCAEKNLLHTWMNEVRINKSHRSFQEIIARYFAVANSTQAQFVWQDRLHNYDDYMKDGPVYLEKINKIFRKKNRMDQEMWERLVIECTSK